jgi:hypothetical protein
MDTTIVDIQHKSVVYLLYDLLKNVSEMKGFKCSFSLSFKMWGIFYTHVLMIPNNRLMKRDECEKLCMERARNKKGKKESQSTLSYKRGYFRVFWNECLSPKLPFMVIDTAMGLGIYIKRRITFEKLSRVLKGTILFFGAEQFEFLRKRGISNLYQDCGDVNTAREPFCGFMYGPLSLVNHICETNIQFGLPHTAIDQVTTKKRNIIEMKYVDESGKSNPPLIIAHKEFTITYSHDSMPFKCLCSSCTAATAAAAVAAAAAAIDVPKKRQRRD